MARIAMLLANPFRPDPRVLKEARSLTDHGHQVMIICWDRENAYPASERLAPTLQVRRLQGIRSSYGIGARQILPLMRFWLASTPALNAFDPDVVHCHDFDTLPAGLLWGKFHRRRVIYDAHEHYADLVKPRLVGRMGTWLYRVIHSAESVCASLADAVITVDETLAAIYRRLHNNVIVLGHYPPIQMAQVATPVFSRAELTMVYAGRLSSDRGLQLYADLLRNLINQGIPARLKLVGVFTPKQEEQLFASAVQGLETHVEITGWLPYDTMSEALRTADVGLALFQSEARYLNAMPVKLFEYMACGLPVVASDFPAIASVVRSADCGALVDAHVGAQDIARILISWWMKPENPQRLGENGRKAALNMYNWENLEKRLINLYLELLGQAASPG